MSSNIEPILGFPPSSFLSDFIIEKITVDGIDDSRTSKARIQFSGKYCGYEMTVNWKDGKKEGVGLILYPDGEPYMEMTFVNDLAEGTVLKKDEYGQIVLRGVLEHGVECGLFEEFDDEEVIWRGFYRNGKRYSILEEQELEGLYLEVSEDGKLLSVSEYDDKWRKNGRCYEVESGHLKRECVYENGIRKRMIQEFTDDGLMIEYDDNGEIVDEEVFEGDMIGFMIHPEMMIGTKEYYIDMNENGELLSVSEYDEDGLLKNGKCFEYEEGRLVRECEYEDGVKQRVIREFTDDGLWIEYDDNGDIVYEEELEGDMMNGFIREEKGSEYGSDGKSVLYVGGWKNGLREGYGSEFKGYSPVYIGEWKNGMRDGKGKELNENGEVIRSGVWVRGNFSSSLAHVVWDESTLSPPSAYVVLSAGSNPRPSYKPRSRPVHIVIPKSARSKLKCSSVTKRSLPSVPKRSPSVTKRSPFSAPKHSPKPNPTSKPDTKSKRSPSAPRRSPKSNPTSKSDTKPKYSPPSAPKHPANPTKSSHSPATKPTPVQKSKSKAAAAPKSSPTPKPRPVQKPNSKPSTKPKSASAPKSKPNSNPKHTPAHKAKPKH